VLLSVRALALPATLALFASACSSSTASKPPAATAMSPASQARAAAPAPTLPARGSCAEAALDVYFPYDSSTLDDATRNRLSQIGQCLREAERRSVTVVGMTDPRGTEEYNLALGERRAHAVASYLAALDTNPPSVRSLGEEQATGRDERGWAQDRRAEVR
jgi:peptidoglycan-associated lipoprotein